MSNEESQIKEMNREGSAYFSNSTEDSLSESHTESSLTLTNSSSSKKLFKKCSKTIRIQVQARVKFGRIRFFF